MAEGGATANVRYQYFRGMGKPRGRIHECAAPFRLRLAAEIILFGREPLTEIREEFVPSPSIMEIASFNFSTCICACLCSCRSCWSTLSRFVIDSPSICYSRLIVIERSSTRGMGQWCNGDLSQATQEKARLLTPKITLDQQPSDLQRTSEFAKSGLKF